MQKAEVIARGCQSVAYGRMEDAADIVAREYPFVPFTRTAPPGR
jgi:hypothetical protein